MTIPHVQFTPAAGDQAHRRSPQDFVRNMDDDKLSCRADRHSFPKLRTGPLPRGVRAVPTVDGAFQLTFTCPDCGTRRTRTTRPGGSIDRSVAYSYNWPDGYLAPKGSGLVKADFSAEQDRRIAPYIRRAAQ